MKVTEEKQAEIPVTEAVEATVRERLKTIERDSFAGSAQEDRMSQVRPSASDDKLHSVL